MGGAVSPRPLMPAWPAQRHPYIYSDCGFVVFRRVQKLRKAALSFDTSVSSSIGPHATTRLPWANLNDM